MPAGEYIPRVIDAELDALFSGLPAIALDGPKGVGKTATALERARTAHRLDDAAQRQLIEADPARLVDGDPPVLIDEWQRFPASWDVVRRAVDDDPIAGRFLLTGSATPTEHPTHSGAGRIVSIRMRPMSLSERGVASPVVSLARLLDGAQPEIGGRCEVSLEGYADEIVRSGFPGLRGLDGRPLRAQLDSYLDRIVEHDFQELGHRIRRPGTLRRWLGAYAAATSTTTSYEKIRDAATSGDGDKPSKSATGPYRDILERLWVLDDVPGWRPARNHLGRLTEAPKHHLCDPALAARLLGAETGALLRGDQLGPSVPRDGPLLGALFESLVTLSVRVYAQHAEATVRHLRVESGRREIDLVVERGDHRVVAIEVKLSQTVDNADVHHLLWLRDMIGEDLLDAVVITTGREAYRRRDGVAVVPAALLGP